MKTGKVSDHGDFTFGLINLRNTIFYSSYQNCTLAECEDPLNSYGIFDNTYAAETGMRRFCNYRNKPLLSITDPILRLPYPEAYNTYIELNISYVGGYDILESGVVWGPSTSDPIIGTGTKIVATGTPPMIVGSYQIFTNITRGTAIIVKGYAKILTTESVPRTLYFYSEPVYYATEVINIEYSVYSPYYGAYHYTVYSNQNVAQDINVNFGGAISLYIEAGNYNSGNNNNHSKYFEDSWSGFSISSIHFASDGAASTIEDGFYTYTII